MYLDVVINIVSVILGQDLATYLVYLANGVLLLSIIANGAILSISVISIALFFWTDNEEYIYDTYDYYYNLVMTTYNDVMTWYTETRALVEEWIDAIIQFILDFYSNK